MSEINQYDSLKRLKELLDAGILTQEEFNKEKAKILGNIEDANLTDEQKAHLKKIEALKEAGILTVEEFEEQRREILSAGPDSWENYSLHIRLIRQQLISPHRHWMLRRKRGALCFCLES